MATTKKTSKAKVVTKEPKKIGRPTDFNQAICDAICERKADGESLRSICREEAMPNKATVFRWLNKYKEFGDQYARASEEQAETLADDLIEIADKASQPLLDFNGIPLTVDGKVVMVVDAASVNHAKLKVDARKWVASKLKPKKYGDAVNLNHSGKIDLTDDQIELRLAQLFGKAGIVSSDGVEESQVETKQD